MVACKEKVQKERRKGRHPQVRIDPEACQKAQKKVFVLNRSKSKPDRPLLQYPVWSTARSAAVLILYLMLLAEAHCNEIGRT